MRNRELTLVTGAVDSGKTSWCLSLVDRERDFDGVLLRKVFQGNRRIGYDAVRISSRTAVPFSRLKGAEPDGWHPAESVGAFTVSIGGKQAANRWLLEALAGPARGLLVDEVGPLELEGGGLAASLRRILADASPRRLILVIRQGCLERAITAFRLPAHHLLKIEGLDTGSTEAVLVP